jgi:hypothetical protein
MITLATDSTMEGPKSIRPVLKRECPRENSWSRAVRRDARERFEIISKVRRQDP